MAIPNSGKDAGSTPAPTPGTSQALTQTTAVEALAGILFPKEPEDQAKLSESNATDELSVEETLENALSAGEPAESEEPENTPEDGASDSDDANPADAPRMFTVKIDGKDEQVPEDELLKGYSRTADYTRKSQALAEKRKAAEADAEKLRAERAQYAELLGALEEAVKNATPKEPDWATLRAVDPERYAELRDAWDAHTKQVAAIEAERKKAADAVAEDHKSKMQTVLKTEQEKLLEAVPEWKDPKVFEANAVKLVEYGKQYGLTPQDLAEVVDHRVIVFMRKAMLYDAALERVKSNKGRTGAVSSAALRPGGKSTTVHEKPADAARKRLARDGRVEDAAVVISSLLGDD